jgi:YbbR domain-containing protein
MKRLILKNWRAKLISLLLATTLWYLIKKNVATTPSPSESASGATTTERR